MLAIGQGVRLLMIGVALGLLAAIAIARLIESSLFGIIVMEWWLPVSVAILLAVVALLATVTPAGRAMKLALATVLRD